MQKMADPEVVDIYGVKWSKWAATLSRRFDIIVAIVLFLAVLSAFHLHFMLLAGDWDFWIDWKDRQWWPTLTPIVAITFPAALQYVFWEKFRLPIGATFGIVCLLIGEWLARAGGFYLWSDFPFSLIWPATLIPGAIVLDTVLLLTGNFLLTAIFGGMGFGLLFYAGNLPMLAAYRLPMEVMNTMVSVGDYIGYAFTRTATPEYVRLIERGTLRTFGGHSAVIASFFAGFASTLMYILWWYIGKFLARVVWVPNKLKTAMGYKKGRPSASEAVAV